MEAPVVEAGVEEQPYSKNDPRRKTSSILPSTWTRRSLSSLMEAEKVGAIIRLGKEVMLILVASDWNTERLRSTHESGA